MNLLIVAVIVSLGWVLNYDRLIFFHAFNSHFVHFSGRFRNLSFRFQPLHADFAKACARATSNPCQSNDSVLAYARFA